MTQELIYTSAPKGLQLGSRGFCTVACTAGMAKPLADRLEAISGYKHLYPPGGESSHLNPVNYSFVTFKLGGKTYYVLSRIADAGLDYTQRSNKLAHHVVLEGSELPPAGPAWLMRQPGFFVTSWEGEPRPIEPRRLPLSPDAGPRKCDVWQSVTGDAGWGGVLAGNDEISGSMEANIVFAPPGEKLLALVDEAQSLLPASKRWGATFSTYYSKLPPGVECHWRFLPHDSPEAVVAARSHGTLLITLVTRSMAQRETQAVLAARNGETLFNSVKSIAAIPKTIHSKSHSILPAPTEHDTNKVAPTLFPQAPATTSPPSLPPSPLLKQLAEANSRSPIHRASHWKYYTAILGIVLIAMGIAFAFFASDSFRISRKHPVAITSEELTPNSVLTATPTDENAPLPAADIAHTANIQNFLFDRPTQPLINERLKEARRTVGKTTAISPQPPKPEVPPSPDSQANKPLPLEGIRSLLPVPRVLGSASLGAWDKPISVGVLQNRTNGDFEVFPIGLGKHAFSVTKSDSQSLITDSKGNKVAAVDFHASDNNTVVTFSWLESALSSPSLVSAISWGGLQISQPAPPRRGLVILIPNIKGATKEGLSTETPLRFNANLSALHRRFEIPRNQNTVFRCRIDDGLLQPQGGEQALGSQVDFVIDSSLGISLRASVVKANESPDYISSYADATFELVAALPSSQKAVSISDAIALQQEEERSILVEAIEHYAQDKAGVIDVGLIERGLRYHHPDLRQVDYLSSLNSLSMKKLRKFAELARATPPKPVHDRLLSHYNRIEGLEGLQIRIPRDISVNLQVVRILDASDGELRESEIFHAGIFDKQD